MSTKRMETWTFRLVGTDAHQVYLEFDGLAGLRSGLTGFLRDWATAPIRPKGTCFTVWAEGRDFASLMWFGPDTGTLRVSLGSYLLLRVDSEHPYFGDRDPGWVLVKPNSDSVLPPDLVASVKDSAPDVVEPAKSEVLTAVGP